MNNLIRLIPEELTSMISTRKGETKLGERVILLPENTDLAHFLKQTEARFVIFGIPEDIGIRANFGRAGASKAYQNTLKALVNIQHNKCLRGQDIVLLGHIDTDSLMQRSQGLNPENKEDLKMLRYLVSELDKEVTHLISIIVGCGKIPIAIGGGHNNAYGMLKGSALALGNPIKVVNFDAHTDFRALEGRHSGNGFSYAFHEGFLSEYFIFGLHENYTSKNIFQDIKETQGKVQYNTYEQIQIRKETSFSKEIQRVSAFVSKQPFGIEIDLDAVAGVASSAMTMSGFSAEKLRTFLHLLGAKSQVCYLHICEGAPELSDDKNPNLIGKLITYLISDFIKARKGTSDV